MYVCMYIYLRYNILHLQGILVTKFPNFCIGFWGLGTYNVNVNILLVMKTTLMWIFIITFRNVFNYNSHGD